MASIATMQRTHIVISQGAHVLMSSAAVEVKAPAKAATRPESAG